MTAQPYPRPVSGEIVTARGTGPAYPSPRGGGAEDVVDAEFEEIGKPALGRPAPPPASGATAARQTGLGVLDRVAPVCPPMRGERAGAAFWLFGALVAAGAFWISGGHALVHKPQPLSSQGGVGEVRLARFTSRIETHSGKSIVIVDGELANGGGRAVRVPPLSIDVETRDGRTTRYHLGAAGSMIAPRGRFRFSSRLDAPKGEVEEISITFMEDA